MLRPIFSTAAAVASLAATTAAQETPQAETVLGGLNNPCGVAVQPGTYHVFVSNSGAGQVLRVDADALLSAGEGDEAAGAASAVISGFGKDVYGKGPMYDIGPLGLVFLDQNTLVVGGGDKPDGEELLRAYTIPAAGESLEASDTKWVTGPIGPGDASPKGEGNFYGLAADRGAVYVTCNGDDTKGWVSRAKLRGSGVGPLEPFIATKVAVSVDAPVGITIGPEGEVVIGQMGEITVPGDSLLSFYGAASGELLRSNETGLFDITDLKYGPEDDDGNRRLYALDFAWMDTSEGGLYRLDEAGEDGVEATKIMALDKPAAMAFAPDGSLYVAVFGTAEEGDDKPSGSLLKITGDL